MNDMKQQRATAHSYEKNTARARNIARAVECSQSWKRNQSCEKRTAKQLCETKAEKPVKLEIQTG